MSESELDFSTLKLPFNKGDWVDADTRIFHACFAILGQYVEDELGKEPSKFGNKEGKMHRGYCIHARDGRDEKAIDLWLWYRDELPALIKDYDKDIAECFSGEVKTKAITINGVETHEIVDFIKVREPKYEHNYPQIVSNQKLQELMAIRQSLWT